MTRPTVKLTPVPGAKPRYDDDGREIVDIATCGTCGRSWNDAAVSSITPAPSGRCPFESEHDDDDDDDDEPRYDVMDATYYELHVALPWLPPAVKPLYGVLDTESGYIAFTTDDDVAARIVRALTAMEEER